LREIHADGFSEINPLFRNFEKDNTVAGYGIGSPGRMYQQIMALRNGSLPAPERAAAATPMALGFYTTLVLEAAEKSLAEGSRPATGVTLGQPVDLGDLVRKQLGKTAAKEYRLTAH
jgi:hypothetical protein